MPVATAVPHDQHAQGQEKQNTLMLMSPGLVNPERVDIT